MSPINKKRLDLIRIKLDKLDTELLKLIKKRSNLVNVVLKIKITCYVVAASFQQKLRVF